MITRFMLTAVIVATAPLFAGNSKVSEKPSIPHAGSYSDAIKSLPNNLTSKASQIQAISSALPDSLGSWFAEPLQSNPSSSSTIPETISASRYYSQKHGSGHIAIQIDVDSPLYHNVALELSTPAAIAASGSVIQVVQGRSCILHFNEANQAGYIQILASNHHLVTIHSYAVSRAALVDFANTLNLAAISSN